MSIRDWLFAQCLVGGFLLAGCGSDGAGDAAHEAYPGADLGMPPVAAGYVRYVSEPISVGPGEDVIWNEWITPPQDQDMDVIDVLGRQSRGGHHALLVSTTDVQALGFSREWRETDMLNSRTVAGTGGDGKDTKVLPPGATFRIKQGAALQIQSHFANTTNNALLGRSAFDVKLGPADPNAKVAAIFAVTTLDLLVKPQGTTTIETRCDVKEEVKLLNYANHMHEWGVAASTLLIGADGSTRELKIDRAWDPLWAFHPNYTQFSVEAPAILPAGSTVSTTCTWSNDSAEPLEFPSEMCVFTGFVLGDADVACVNGTWSG
jgi:hypothetical protein